MTLEYLEIEEAMSKRKNTVDNSVSEVKEVAEAKATAEVAAASSFQAPADDSGCQAVAVLMAASDDVRTQLAVDSVKHNLCDADAVLVTFRQEEGESLGAALVSVLQSDDALPERMVLMTDQMLLLNPVTLADVACMKASGGRLPFGFYRSAMVKLLTQCGGVSTLDTVDGLQERYIQYAMPQGYRPIELGDWRTDPWLLPVVSRNPDADKIDRLAEWKKMAWVSPLSWTDAVVETLQLRFQS